MRNGILGPSAYPRRQLNLLINVCMYEMYRVKYLHVHVSLFRLTDCLLVFTTVILMYCMFYIFFLCLGVLLLLLIFLLRSPARTYYIPSWMCDIKLTFVYSSLCRSTFATCARSRGARWSSWALTFQSSTCQWNGTYSRCLLLGEWWK